MYLISSAFINWNSFKQEMFFLPHLFAYSIIQYIYISMDTWIDVLGIIIQYYHVFCSNCLLQQVEFFFQAGFRVHLACPSLFFLHFFIFWQHKIFQIHLVLFLFGPEISDLFKEFWFLFLEMLFRN